MFVRGVLGWLLLLLLLLVRAQAKVGSSSELDFCTETAECLLFEPVCRTSDYEVRRYSSVKWVSTDESSFFMEMASMSAFRRLFRYISGDNRQGVKIAMTSPVLMKVVRKERFWHQGKFTMSFLLPSDFQDDEAPQPNDSQVYVHQMPNVTVYVRSYGGWMTGWRAERYAQELRYDVTAAGGDLEDDFYFSVGYNSPMTMFNRHNEVWYVAENEPSCGRRPRRGDDSSEELDRRR